MTGVVVRIMRDGRPQNLDVDEMTEEELRAFLETKPPIWVLNLAVILAGWIRDNVRGTDGDRTG